MSLNRTALQILTLAWGAVILVVALWPFAWEAGCRICPNGAMIEPGGASLAFNAPGLVQTAVPPAALHAFFASSEKRFAVALEVAPARLMQSGPGRIVSVSRDPQQIDLLIGQKRDALVFRIRTTETRRNGADAELIFRNVFVDTTVHALLISCDGMACALYRDGARVEALPLPQGELTDWDPAFHLNFGNDASGDRPWLGQILAFAIFAEPSAQSDLAAPIARLALSPADAWLQIDGAQVPLVLADEYRNEKLANFMTLDGRDLRDVLLNVVLWIPIGIFVGLLRVNRGRRSFGLALLAVLLVEASQFFVLGRTASLIDLACSLFGLAVGATLTNGRWADRLRA